jgi:hypothetical protein
MKTVRRFNKFKDWFRLAGVILIPVLLIINNMATLLTSDDGFVIVRSLLFIFVLTIIARRLQP